MTPRLRQAVLAARDLDVVAAELRGALALGEPFADPGVEYFGLRNAVFALRDTFLEIVSPVRADTAAGRLLDRRGGDCGYMVMLQVDDLDGARERVRSLGIREVFEVSVPDMVEVHLHPADIRGAIVSLSRPEPPQSWRWGGPGWPAWSAPACVAGATIAVADAAGVSERWEAVLGAPAADAGIRFVEDPGEPGVVEVAIASGTAPRDPVRIGGVRFVFHDEQERKR